MTFFVFWSQRSTVGCLCWPHTNPTSGFSSWIPSWDLSPHSLTEGLSLRAIGLIWSSWYLDTWTSPASVCTDPCRSGNSCISTSSRPEQLLTNYLAATGSIEEQGPSARRWQWEGGIQLSDLALLVCWGPQDMYIFLIFSIFILLLFQFSE